MSGGQNGWGRLVPPFHWLAVLAFGRSQNPGARTSWSVGNFHMHESLALFLAQLSVEALAVIETPWGAYSRKLPWSKHAADQAFGFRMGQCRYGTSYQKPTALLASKQVFKRVAEKCRCREPHVRLEGSRRSEAAPYPESLCGAVVQCFQTFCEAQASASGGHEFEGVERSGCSRSRAAGPYRGAQHFVSHLWSTHFAEALPWKVVRAYRFRKPSHINILECHAHKTLMRMSPRA